MAKSLPPLTWFRSFEAAARHLSFTAAAEEIGMTQSAVSQQVKSLEMRLRVPLFVRQPRGLALTDHGRRLLPEVGAPLEALAAATARFEAGPGTDLLTVATSVSVAQWVIAPHLPDFTARHPEIRARFLSAIWPDDFQSARADVEIRFGSLKQVGSDAELLLPNRLVALKSPGLSGALADLPLRADLQSFAGGLSVVDDAEHVEDLLGSSGEFTILLSGGGAATPEALEWMRAAEEAVITVEGDRLRPIISPPGLLGFLGETPTDGQLTSALRLLPRYLTGSVINSDRSLAVITFGTRLDDAEQLLDLRESVRSVLPPPPAGMRVELTGLPMVAVGSYETISADRYLANVLGIVVAGLVLALGLRKRSDAALAVIAAALATGWGLAAVWGAGIGLTPVTIAIGSLTAAVGCEFTVLAAEAARRNDRSLHRAVLLAAAASATGYAVLMFSKLSVVTQFGLLLAVSVGVAMGSAVFVVWLARISGPAEPLNTVDRDRRLVGVK